MAEESSESEYRRVFDEDESISTDDEDTGSSISMSDEENSTSAVGEPRSSKQDPRSSEMQRSRVRNRIMSDAHSEPKRGVLKEQIHYNNSGYPDLLIEEWSKGKTHYWTAYCNISLPGEYEFKNEQSDHRVYSIGHCPIEAGLKSDPVICEKCKVCFKSQDSIAGHVSRGHRISKECPFIGCRLNCDCIATLIVHVKTSHDIKDCASPGNQSTCVQELQFVLEEFSTMDQAQYMKSCIEALTQSKLVRCPALEHAPNVQYFHCPLATLGGSFVNIKPKKSKKEPRSLGEVCTAFVSIKKMPEKIVVQACLNHCGHVFYTTTATLSDEVKEEIKDFLLKGYTASETVEMIKSLKPHDEEGSDHGPVVAISDVKIELKKLRKKGLLPSRESSTVEVSATNL